MVHTEQGFHNQHSSWRDILTALSAVQSVSTEGNCFDNVVMENFFGHLTTEMVPDELFETVDELTTSIHEYITWINAECVQERLKGMTPMEYRRYALHLEPSLYSTSPTFGEQFLNRALAI